MMRTLHTHTTIAAAFLAVGAAITDRAAAAPLDGSELQVVAAHPGPRSLTAAVSTSISVEFDRPLDPATVNTSSFWAFGRWSGAVPGTLTLSNGDRMVTLDPDDDFSAGETVMVILSHDLKGADAAPLRAAGYSFQFWTKAGVGTMKFEEIAMMTTRTTPSVSTRSYGGVASDMNNDGFLDVTVVNEDTADLRVFLNTADGAGTFHPFLQPPAPVGPRASPSEPSDFNRDGNVDVCVANINEDTVSILLGNGDGTFGPEQVVAVGDMPRGIAVLDVDGDGDTDIVNTNSTSGGSGDMSVLLNFGNGVFGPATFFEAGVNNEWALAAADMNEDGILDLVIGSRADDTITIWTGDGGGTFSFASAVVDGPPNPELDSWMLVCGDVNGDGHEDVATCNAVGNTGSILLGDGAARLDPPQFYSTPSFPLATDLADLDGDGDLDWITSSYSGGRWRVFTNDGAGTFAFDQDFVAPTAASCSLPFDFDNDGDLDLALIDELADVVVFMRNTGSPPCPGDFDGSGDIGFADLLEVLSNWGPCVGCPQDIDGSGDVGFGDLLIVLSTWGPCS